MSQAETTITDQPDRRRHHRSLRSVGSVALTHAPERIQRSVEDVAIRRIIRSKGFDAGLITDSESISKALDLEVRVWEEKGYGDLEDYKKYLDQSRIFASFDNEECVGLTRLFAGTPEAPPFLEGLPIYDKDLKQQLIQGSRQAKVEEYGTVAVKKDLRGGRIFLDLCRAAYRDATERDIQTWGIIMEPERVEQMNRMLSFTFKQIGPTLDYQGGMCAAHVMDFDEVRLHMSSTKPELYDWFVNQPL